MVSVDHFQLQRMVGKKQFYHFTDFQGAYKDGLVRLSDVLLIQHSLALDLLACHVCGPLCSTMTPWATLVQNIKDTWDKKAVARFGKKRSEFLRRA